jgi:putative oxidoreductase
MFRRLLRTEGDAAPALARLALALVIFPHGTQHVLGWFGGYGFAGTYGWMTAPRRWPSSSASAAVWRLLASWA